MVGRVTDPRRHSEDTKAAAVALYAEHGLAEAARRTRLAKPTISRWAKAAGVTAPSITERNRAKTEAAMVEAAAARRTRRADAREKLTDMQAHIALLAGQLTIDMLDAAVKVSAAAKVSPNGMVDATLLARLNAVMSGLRLPDVIGAGTRAIHDLNLLDGEATERPDAAGMVVVFAVSAPSVSPGAPPPRIIDLPPEDVRDVDG